MRVPDALRGWIRDHTQDMLDDLGEALLTSLVPLGS